MLEGIQTEEVKRLYIGPAIIDVTDIRMNEESPISENQYTNKNEARIDVRYNLEQDGQMLIEDQFFSFYISEELFNSSTGKTQFVTDKSQFIWAPTLEEAKKGLERSNNGNSYFIVHPSDDARPAYRKLEPFMSFLTSIIRFNPKKGNKGDLYALLEMDKMFSNPDAFNEKLQALTADLKTKQSTKVRVMFLVDDQGRNRIDTKNNESFGFAGQADFSSIKRAIEKKAASAYPYISGVFSLTFQEFDPQKMNQYAEEISELSGAAQQSVDSDVWDAG